MNHPVTLGGLLLAFGVIAGIVIIGFGVLDAFANGMADTQGDRGDQGCALIVIGGILLLITLVCAFA